MTQDEEDEHVYATLERRTFMSVPGIAMAYDSGEPMSMFQIRQALQRLEDVGRVERLAHKIENQTMWRKI